MLKKLVIIPGGSHPFAGHKALYDAALHSFLRQMYSLPQQMIKALGHFRLN